MEAVRQVLHTSSRSLSYVLGAVVAVVAVAAIGASMSVGGVFDWAIRIFGATFIALLSALVFVTSYCLQKMKDEPANALWFEAGMQAAGGITTLALTYTLMGISLGIQSLSNQALTPETVQGIIQELTAKFGMAFMTTVVGLPIAAVLRTGLVVTKARSES